MVSELSDNNFALVQYEKIVFYFFIPAWMNILPTSFSAVPAILQSVNHSADQLGERTPARHKMSFQCLLT
jgi:hypothetical protein